MLEGITPGFNALSRYIREVDSPEHLDRSKFATAVTNDYRRKEDERDY